MKEISRTYKKIRDKFPYSLSSLRSFNEADIHKLLKAAIETDEPFINTAEAAKILGVTENKIRSLAKQGFIPAFKFVSGAWFFKKSLLSLYTPSEYYIFSSSRRNLYRLFIDEIFKLISENKNNFSREFLRRAAIFQDYFEGLSLNELSDAHGVSPERIRQIIRKFPYKAINKLFQYKLYDDEAKELERLRRRNSILNIENAKLRRGINKIDTYKDFKEPTYLEDIDLSVRAYNCLKKAKINTDLDLKAWDEKSLLSLRDLGKSTIYELRTLGLLQ